MQHGSRSRCTLVRLNAAPRHSTSCMRVNVWVEDSRLEERAQGLWIVVVTIGIALFVVEGILRSHGHDRV